jgi:two-component system, OmpR family, KDP operon response regulator KdpE
MRHQNVLVVDDEAAMRKLLLNNLKAAGYTVQAAADGSEALKFFNERIFDLVLLDVNMPGPNGFEVLEAVRREAETPVLVVSGRKRESDVVEAFNRGADDYLSKPFGVAELLARVKALLRRSTPAGRGPQLRAYRHAGLEVDFQARRAKVDGTYVPLTKREFEVLAYLARNAGTIVLHRQLLQAVWGAEYGDESDYIWTFVQRIRRKIEPDRHRPRYLLTETGVGYRMPTPDPYEVEPHLNLVEHHPSRADGTFALASA